MVAFDISNISTLSVLITCSLPSLDSTIFATLKLRFLQSLFIFMRHIYDLIATSVTMFMRLFYLSSFASIVAWLLLASAASIALITQKGFVVIVLGYTVLASVVLCFGLQTAYAVTLYPTSCRAAATSLLVMCGRLGSASGGIMIGWLLSNGCDAMFYMFAVTLASKPIGQLLILKAQQAISANDYAFGICVACVVLSVFVKDSRNGSNGLNGQQ